jgi:hypothetical protein
VPTGRTARGLTHEPGARERGAAIAVGRTKRVEIPATVRGQLAFPFVTLVGENRDDTFGYDERVMRWGMSRLACGLAAAILVAGCSGASVALETSSSGAPQTEDSGEASTSAASESGSESESTSDDGDDDGATFVNTDTTCSTLRCSYCDPTRLDDCPDGEKCSAVALPGSEVFEWNACVPIVGDLGAGEPCSVFGDPFDGRDDCGNGLICLGEPFRCVGFCDSSFDCALGSQTSCVAMSSGVLPLCREICDPLAPTTTCQYDTDLCIPLAQDPVCFPGGGGGGTYGASCFGVAACDYGHLCADQTQVPSCPASSCCTEICDVTQPNACPDAATGQECIPVYEPGLTPYDKLGFCGVPP